LDRSELVLVGNSTDAFTFETWVRPSTRKTQWQMIFAQVNSSPYNNRYALFLEETSAGQRLLHFSMGSQNLSITAPFVRGAWNHVAVSVSGGTATFYLDGQSLGTLSPGRTNPGSVFSLGGSRHGDAGFDGQMDNVKVWGAALSQAQLQESMHVYAKGTLTNALNLRAHYDFNEFTEDLVIDRSGNNRHLTPSTTSIWSSSLLDSQQITETSTAHNNLQNVVEFNRTVLTAAGGWTRPSSTTRFKSLVVAGGGGGGAWVGGGGGAGGLLESANLTISDSVIPIVVGQGGAGARHLGNDTFVQNNVSHNGRSGQVSRIGTLVSALGGGRGGSIWGNGTSNNAVPGSGGSGGGGIGFETTGRPGAQGEPGQGNTGGAGDSGTYRSGGRNNCVRSF
jgi:hypothetical protein